MAAAAGVCRWLNARASQPVRGFRRIVPVALIVSLVPNVLVWAADGYAGAASAETVLPLMAMHVCAAAACWFLLPALAVQPKTFNRRGTPVPNGGSSA